MTEITQVTEKNGTVKIEIQTDDRVLAALATTYVENLQKIMHKAAEGCRS